MASGWARHLTLRWLGVSWLLTTLALLLVAASSFGYFRLRGVLWADGIRNMDRLFMSKVGAVHGRLVSDMDEGEFYQRVDHSVEVPPDWAGRAAEFSSGIYAVQLLDTQGQLLASAPAAPPPAAEDLVQLQQFRAQLGSPGGSARLSYRSGTDRQILLIPLACQGKLVGFAMISKNWRPYREVLLTFAKVNTAVVTTILLAILAVYLSLAKELSGPLQRLVLCARQAAAGDLKARSQLQPGANEIYLVGAAFDAMLDRLERGFQAQQNFVADVSHELRTPLTALAGQLHTLEILQPSPPPGVERALQRCDKELDRMVALVEDLMALIRAVDGPAQGRPFCLNSLVEESLNTVRALFPERQLLWQAGADADFRGDPEACRRAVQNLLHNACCYTQGSVTISAQAEAQGIRLDVQDEGPGIPSECLAQLGQRFFRPDSSRSRHTGGSGLGLAIAQATAQQHGGWLRLTSQPGQGTTASLYLPIC